jgi:hypothetical protein
LAIGGITTYWLQLIVRYEDGIGASKYLHMYSRVIRSERQMSLKLLLVNPRKANITRTLRNSCTVPFCRLLAVLFATTAICIAERKLLLRVDIAEPRRNFEIRLK